MMLYKFTARNKAGEDVKGSVEANDISAFYGKLEQDGLLCVEVREFPVAGQEVKTIYKLKTKELVLFCRKISTMLASGMSITNSLDIMSASAEHAKLSKVYLFLYEAIKGGKALSAALRDCGNSFPALLINMVESGEESGNLDLMFKKLSLYYEKQQKINSKIKTATTYPKVLAFMVVAVVIILFAFVLPSIFEIFEDLESLPGITRAIIAMSDFITNWRNWGPIITVGVIAFILFKTIFRMPKVRFFIHKQLLGLPKFGPLVNKIYSARFANTLSILYASGLSLLNGIHLASKVMGNVYLEQRLTIIMDKISVGNSLSESLAEEKILDRLLGSMVKIGEETGSLDTILESVSDFYDQETETAIETMLGMLEPIMLVIMAAVIGTILVSVMYPIFLLYQQIGA